MDKKFYEMPECEVIDLKGKGAILIASGGGEDDGGAASEGGEASDSDLNW